MADPLYRQIANDLRQKIESGALEPGSQLPTELELREQYDHASRNTIRDAIKWLANRRLVSIQPGRGTFVVEKIKPFIVPLTPDKAGSYETVAFDDVVRLQGGTPSVSDPRVEIQNAGAEVARELQIERGSQIISRHQERRINGLPSSLQTSFYPMEFVDEGAVELLQAKDIVEGATRYLEKKFNIEQRGYRDRLTVRQPNPGEVTFFRIPDNGTVLVVVTHRTTYDNNGKPIRFTVTVYPADRNHFVIDFGNVPPLESLVQEI